jgi:hypothetical protein
VRSWRSAPAALLAPRWRPQQRSARSRVVRGHSADACRSRSSGSNVSASRRSPQRSSESTLPRGAVRRSDQLTCVVPCLLRSCAARTPSRALLGSPLRMAPVGLDPDRTAPAPLMGWVVGAGVALSPSAAWSFTRPQRNRRRHSKPYCPSHAGESNSQNLWIGVSCGLLTASGLVGSFDELAVVESGSCSHQGDEVRCVHRAPAMLG